MYWYNRTATERNLGVGEQVSVFLPNESNKLLTDWQGPYVITKQITPCTCEVDVHDRKKRKRVFHINSLKKWHSPEAAVLLCETQDGLSEEDSEDLAIPSVVKKLAKR